MRLVRRKSAIMFRMKYGKHTAGRVSAWAGIAVMAVLATLLFSCKSTPQTDARHFVCEAYVPDAQHIDVHGNVYLGRHDSKLLRGAFGTGDTALVSLLGKTNRLTVVRDIHHAAPGSMVLHFRDGDPPYDRLAVVNGPFARTAGIARQILGTGGKPLAWVPEDGVAFPVKVTIERENALARPQSRDFGGRSNARADYPHLTDAEFANFRPIVAPLIPAGLLYRSSSPIDPSLGRSRYANAALVACGVKTVWNMADTHDAVLQMLPEDSGYSKCRVHAQPLGTDFNSPLFKTGIQDGLLYLARNEPPYLIHCKEGRDRTGFVAILLEALGGATRAEIKADYAKSYQNYALGGEFDRAQMEQSFAYCLEALGMTNALDSELKAQALAYLRSIGLKDDKTTTLMLKLSRKPGGQSR